MIKIKELINEVVDLDWEYERKKEEMKFKLRKEVCCELKNSFEELNPTIVSDSNSYIIFDLGGGKAELKFFFSFYCAHNDALLSVNIINKSDNVEIPIYIEHIYFYSSFNDFIKMLELVKVIINFCIDIYKNNEFVVSFSPSSFDIYDNKNKAVKSIYSNIEGIFDNEQFVDSFSDEDGDVCYNYVNGFSEFLKDKLENYKNGYYLKLKEE